MPQSICCRDTFIFFFFTTMKAARVLFLIVQKLADVCRKLELDYFSCLSDLLE